MYYEELEGLINRKINTGFSTLDNFSFLCFRLIMQKVNLYP